MIISSVGLNVDWLSSPVDVNSKTSPFSMKIESHLLGNFDVNWIRSPFSMKVESDLLGNFDVNSIRYSFSMKVQTDLLEISILFEFDLLETSM